MRWDITEAIPTPESVATLPPFSPIEGRKWFDQISSQWESQKNLFALIYFGKIQLFTSLHLKSPVPVHRLWSVFLSLFIFLILICSFYFFRHFSLLYKCTHCRIFENTYVFRIYFVYVHFSFFIVYWIFIKYIASMYNVYVQQTVQPPPPPRPVSNLSRVRVICVYSELNEIIIAEGGGERRRRRSWKYGGLL